MAIVTNLGYPRIGEHRELKKATEAYWAGKSSMEQLLEAGRRLRQENWLKQREAGIKLIPCNDFSYYDQMLDMSCLLGNVPPRFDWGGGSVGLDTEFLMARGAQREPAKHEDQEHDPSHACHAPMFAGEMTKWFDTNYHYIVPEFSANTRFALSNDKVFNEFAEARTLGINAKPVLIGPITYLLLGKVHDPQNPGFDKLALLDRLVPIYEEILARLAGQGAEWIQMDEPILALDLTDAQRAAFRPTYQRLSAAAGKAKLLVAAYFGELRENLPTLIKLPVGGVHFDAVRGRNEVSRLLAEFPADKVLSLGVVDGRNVWKNDLAVSLALLNGASSRIGKERLWIAPSCSLIHSPISLKNEPGLDAEVKNWLAFADEKLAEVVTLGQLLEGNAPSTDFAANQAALASRRSSPKIHNPAVKTRLADVGPQDFKRRSPFLQRQPLQRAKLQLPPLPTTSIGSFPQTTEVRGARAKWKKGELSDALYDDLLKQVTRRCVEFQEYIGMDMLVHGEFERNDMVEYFGELLEGFTFTANGWVQSYGSRYVKPPLIFGDVSRPRPMTTYWSAYAQTLTRKPVKGMLTGPITILQWSFVRDDQPRETTAMQIALAIGDEVMDLEKIRIAAIQIDEPALREGLPLRKTDWPAYLQWSVQAFRLCSSGVNDVTQIHTHMCYSEFNDIIHAIADLDADVITIETSRSNMELLNAFVAFRYPNEIGPGVYDIHSPRVPSTEELVSQIQKALDCLSPDQLWVNPDCGLKTRKWEEVSPALTNMVQAAIKVRQNLGLKQPS